MNMKKTSLALATALSLLAAPAFADTANNTAGNLVADGSLDSVYGNIARDYGTSIDQAGKWVGPYSYIPNIYGPGYWANFFTSTNSPFSNASSLGIPLSADGGNAVLASAGYSGNPHGTVAAFMAQSITSLEIGKSYTLSFESYFSDPTNDANLFGNITVKLGSDLNQTISLGKNTTVWELNTFSFIASATTETLVLTPNTTVTPGTNHAIWNGYVGVDGVKIVETVATPVPEPETYAMMLAGLGLMGAVARRRKAKLAN